MTHSIVPAGFEDYRQLARRRLPRFLFDYIDGGANREETLHANRADFTRLALRQRVLRDASALSTDCTLFGQRASMPVALSPLGMAGLYAKRGEVQAARAAQHLNVPFSLSTVGICSVEEVCQATTTPPWFQLYMLRDRDAVRATLERAQQAGCQTLLFTVDLAVAGVRQRDIRNGMLATGWTGKLAKAWQLAQRPSWVWQVGIQGKPHSFGNLNDRVADPEDLHAFKAWLDAQFDPSVTWQDLAWVRAQWPGKLIIKGILDSEDARHAQGIGADGIIVSNHGGRQLDGVPSTISQLPAVAAALKGQLPILLDGGVRNGVDILKALALGADAVMLGRPWAFALAAQGQASVEAYLAEIHQELKVAMALAGVQSLAQIGPDLLCPSSLTKLASHAT